MLVEKRPTMSKATIRQRLSSTGMEDEAALGLLLSEFRRRRRRSTSLYPFVVTAAGIARVEVSDRPYELLLVLSLEDADFRRKADWNTANLYFDLVVGEALTGLLGSASGSLRFGVPASGDRPTDFTLAIRWAARNLGLIEGSGKHLSATQDGGVDVIAWRRFGDNESAFPVILTQCTLERGYTRKGADIALRRWSDWIVFGADPATALAVPFVVDHRSDAWDIMIYDVNVVLDRFRICELLEAKAERHLPDFAGWLDDQLDWLRA